MVLQVCLGCGVQRCGDSRSSAIGGLAVVYDGYFSSRSREVESFDGCQNPVVCVQRVRVEEIFAHCCLQVPALNRISPSHLEDSSGSKGQSRWTSS